MKTNSTFLGTNQNVRVIRRVIGRPQQVLIWWPKGSSSFLCIHPKCVASSSHYVRNPSWHNRWQREGVSCSNFLSRTCPCRHTCVYVWVCVSIPAITSLVHCMVQLSPMHLHSLWSLNEAIHLLTACSDATTTCNASSFIMIPCRQGRPAAVHACTIPHVSQNNRKQSNCFRTLVYTGHYLIGFAKQLLMVGWLPRAYEVRPPVSAGCLWASDAPFIRCSW